MKNAHTHKGNEKRNGLNDLSRQEREKNNTVEEVRVRNNGSYLKNFTFNLRGPPWHTTL